MPGLYGYNPPPLPPSVDMGETIEPPEAEPPRGVMVMGEIKNIEIETDMAPVAESILGLGVAISAVEAAVNALPDKLADAPDDYTPIIDAIDRLAALIASHREEDAGTVVQTIERDRMGNVTAITTKRGGMTRRRTVQRGSDGYITGTVEK